MSAPSAPSPAPSFHRSAVIQPGSGFFATFRALWPYLWPAERADLRGRVVAAFALMVAGRLVLMGVPFT
jgi:ATP-binding cassette subfamily B protein